MPFYDCTIAKITIYQFTLRFIQEHDKRIKKKEINNINLTIQEYSL